jgi:hypothetical protein
METSKVELNEIRKLPWLIYLNIFFFCFMLKSLVEFEVILHILSSRLLDLDMRQL